MRRFSLAMLLLVVAAPVIAADVNWSANLDQALRSANQSESYVLVAVGATYCVSCERNKREVLSDDEVASRINAHFNPVYITADEGDAIYRYRSEDRTGSEMMRLLQLNGFPYYLVFNGQGRLVARTSGAQTIDGFLDFLPEV